MFLEELQGLWKYGGIFIPSNHNDKGIGKYADLICF